MRGHGLGRVYNYQPVSRPTSPLNIYVLGRTLMYNASLCIKLMKLYKSTGTLALLHAEKPVHVYYYNIIMWTCIVMHVDIPSSSLLTSVCISAGTSACFHLSPSRSRLNLLLRLSWKCSRNFLAYKKRRHTYYMYMYMYMCSLLKIHLS